VNTLYNYDEQLPNMADIELKPPAPPRVFVGRDTELEWLRVETMRRERYIDWSISVRGEAGVGKTALVSQLLAADGLESQSFWVACREWARGFPDYEGAIKARRLDLRGGNRAIVIFDGVEDISYQRFNELYRRTINYKPVRTIILTSRRTLRVRREGRDLLLSAMSDSEAREFLRRATSLANLDEESTLKLVHSLKGSPLGLSIVAGAADSMSREQLQDFLAGKIFEFKDLPWSERREIVVTAKPILISTNQAIIEKLKKKPTDVSQLSPRQFEEMIAELLGDQGYDVELTPATRDGGMDILASFKAPGARFLCLVEAKKYRQDRKVGVELVRGLYGTLHHHQASSAMLVTTSTYSKVARAFEQQHRYQLALNDYTDVAGWIQKYRTHKLN
jgi:restriction system protein